jgi:nitroimidazol reductase NimA-like FMN-containing flavoprotein (pyridoxamine 5'-phosphate oxidase superfamily)
MMRSLKPPGDKPDYRKMRAMRKAEREMTDLRRIEKVLDEAEVCRLGLADSGEPYVVPVCFGYRDRRIYVHSAREGRKIEILQKNPRVCFEVDRMDGAIRTPNPCGWEVRYRSVIGTGTAVFVEDPLGKAEALGIILAHYGGDAATFPAEALGRVAVIRIDVETMTGKEYGNNKEARGEEGPTIPRGLSCHCY